MDAKTIKQIRNKLKLSQEDFAHELGVTLATVSRWERDASQPSPLALEKLEKLERKAEHGA